MNASLSVNRGRWHQQQRGDATNHDAESGESDQRSWIEGWREVVRSSPHALAFIELPSTRLVELSTAAARLLGIAPEAAALIDLLDVVEPRADIEQTVRLLSVGVLDSVDARCSLRRADQPAVRVRLRAHAVRRGDHTDLVLWATEERAATTASDLAAAPSLVGVLDDRWRIAELVPHPQTFLGQCRSELIGSSILDMMHPADSATLVSAFALATSGINDEVRVRMRDGQGAVQTVSAAATLLDAGDRPHFELSLTTEAARGALLPELSDRQWEVVSRLNRGERVVTIATAMYLSQSTIRNHLSAIFEKVGVHSQRELLDALRPDQHVSLERRTRASARSFGT